VVMSSDEQSHLAVLSEAAAGSVQVTGPEAARWWVGLCKPNVNVETAK